MTKTKWIKFRSWSGVKINGTEKFKLNTEQQKLHMWRAVWLTSVIEGGGKFGAVQSYDGAGISAGLEHKIAVLPRTQHQGSLWKLLRKMEVACPCEPLEELWDAFKQEKMYISQDGKLRKWDTGALASVKEIRDIVAPPDGKVPEEGSQREQADRWAVLFHNLFSNEKTYSTQINSTIDYLVSNNKKNEKEAYEVSVGISHPTAAVYGQNITPELDLAWCVYHSFTPNGPGLAKRRLKASKPDGTKEWPKRLIKTLGTTNYGRWHDTPTGKGRYDRTRRTCMRSGWWPEELFEGTDAIMPENF